MRCIIRVLNLARVGLLSEPLDHVLQLSPPLLDVLFLPRFLPDRLKVLVLPEHEVIDQALMILVEPVAPGEVDLPTLPRVRRDELLMSEKGGLATVVVAPRRRYLVRKLALKGMLAVILILLHANF